MDNSVSSLHVKLYSPHISSMFSIMNLLSQEPYFLWNYIYGSTSLFILNYIIKTNYYIIKYISNFLRLQSTDLTALFRNRFKISLALHLI